MLNSSSNSIFSMAGGTTKLIANLTHTFNKSRLMFITNSREFYADYYWNSSIYSIVKGSTESGIFATVMSIGTVCYHIFVDLSANIYCSMPTSHIVNKYLVDPQSNSIVTVAGNGSAGSAAEFLNSPRGILVTASYDLYVADCGNDRIQMFSSGAKTGITVSQNRSTVQLNCPSAIILDHDANLYILDSSNTRIVRSGPQGLGCIAGCNATPGSQPNQLNGARSFSFDSLGNIFVADTGNSRIQLFLFQTSSCNNFNSREPSTHYLITTESSQTTQITSHTPLLTSPTACDVLQPCQNNGTCIPNNTVSAGFQCVCLPNLNGAFCEIDRRPCQSNTCWHNGSSSEHRSFRSTSDL